MDIAWLFLIVAGLFEPCWVISLEKSEKFRNIKWTASMCVFLFLSMFLLSLAMKTIGPGTSYAVWTGIGAVGTLAIGVVMFKEPVKIARIFFIALIIIGIVGINLSTGVV